MSIKALYLHPKQFALLAFLACYTVNNNAISQCLVDTIRQPSLQHDFFGYSIAVASDVVAIGSPLYSSPSAPGCGRCSVYRLQQGRWIHEAEIENPEAKKNARFGMHVALTERWLAVSLDAGLNKGKLYVYERMPTSWQLTQVIDDAKSSGSFYGTEVAISDRWMIVSEHGYPNRLHVYELTTGGWNRIQIIDGNYQALQSDFAQFGRSVDFVSPNEFVVGAPAAGPQLWQGRAFKYKRVLGAWELSEVIGHGVATIGDGFGRTVSVGRGMLAIGAPDSSLGAQNSGACHIYTLDPDSESSLVDTKVDEQHSPFDLLGGRLAVIDNTIAAAASNPSRIEFYVAASGTWSTHAVVVGDSVDLPCLGGSSLATDDTFLAASNICLFSSTGVGVFGVGGSKDCFLDFRCSNNGKVGPSTNGLARVWVKEMPLSSSCLFVASISGSWPGTWLGASQVPLNLDALSSFCLSSPNSAFLPAGFGQLGAFGYRETEVVIPSGVPELAGKLVTMVAIAWGVRDGKLVLKVSNADSASVMN